MVKIGIAFALAMSVLAMSAPVRARDGEAKRAEPLFVSTQWVAEHLKDPSLVLLAVGEEKEYERGHIPGARYLDFDSISTPHGSGLMLELPPAEQLVKVFEDLGVSDDSHVVVYFSDKWMTPAARAFLTLDYLGLRGRISYLDGGLPAWRKEKREISTAKPQFAKGRLTAHPRNDVVVKVEAVQQDLHRAGVAIVDVREPECYGNPGGCYGEKPGHIPGALNIPWEQLVTDDLKLKSADELRGIFAKAGVKAGDEIIAYCHIGQRASFVYLVSRYLGREVRLYDGSYEEWGERKDLPVELSAANGK